MARGRDESVYLATIRGEREPVAKPAPSDAEDTQLSFGELDDPESADPRSVHAFA